MLWCVRASSLTASTSGLSPATGAVMLPVQPHDLGQHVRVAGIAVRARAGVPLPIPRHLPRVDREHDVPGSEQRLHPPAAVGLNADHHPPRRLLRRQLGPLLGRMFTDQRMQSGQPLQPLRKPSAGQPATALVDELDIVMILGPVVPDEQHPPSLGHPGHDQQR